MTDVLVFGESLIDLIAVDGDGNASAPLFRAHPGGSPYNAALALARQGMDAGFATPISTDFYGQLLVNRLAKMGGHYAYPERVTNPTSLAVVTLDAGQASYQFYRRDVADRAVDFDALRALPQPRWVQIGGLAIAPADDGQAWLDHITWMVGQGVKLSFDPNIRPAFIDDRARHRAVCDALVAQASIVKLSDEDAAYLYGTDDPSQELLAKGAGMVALTRGGDGALICQGQDRAIIPVPSGPIRGDTVGAGDTFGAALLSILDTGQADLQALGRYAAAAAFLNCQHQGCHPPTRAEVLAFLQENP